jgi:hypothetical protein
MINKSAFFYNGGHALVLKALRITMTQNRFKTTLTIIYLAQGNVIINYSLFLANIYAYSDSTTLSHETSTYEI